MASITVNLSTGEVTENPNFVAPSFPSETIITDVTETQFIRACVRLNVITTAEGEAYLARGEIPAAMAAVIANLPESVRDDVTLKAVGASKFYRNDDLFAAMVAAGAANDAQIDEVFALAATL